MRNASGGAQVVLLDGGTLEMLTAADAVVSAHALGTPAFQEPVDGVATANAVASDEAAGGIQSFVTKNGTQSGLLIEGNTIIGWTEDPSHPLRSASFQGIGLFDGPYTDLVIRNNIVAITHVHGIAIAGSINSIVSHNTVVDLQPGFKWSPRISSDTDRRGGPPVNAVVANNLAMALASNAASGLVTFTGNSLISSPAAVFEDPAAFDYRPRAASGFIDTADPAYAVARDVFGNARNQTAPTAGAIEV
ncbi:MAG: hypothetical protein CVT80_00315 [Alphaproteobacteria bacterium HGW-Alphaproteobacteria-2]|nr:MAG: hypothetical protein CVT80_00315 [Alphaproteobacteria bacterium HGW-Alphaproteobacteria-2]